MINKFIQKSPTRDGPKRRLIAKEWAVNQYAKPSPRRVDSLPYQSQFSRRPLGKDPSDLLSALEHWNSL